MFKLRYTVEILRLGWNRHFLESNKEKLPLMMINGHMSLVAGFRLQQITHLKVLSQAVLWEYLMLSREGFIVYRSVLKIYIPYCQIYELVATFFLNWSFRLSVQIKSDYILSVPFCSAYLFDVALILTEINISIFVSRAIVMASRRQ